MNTEWWLESATAPDEPALQRARERQLSLTKPPGSLGRLEEVACTIAAMQANDVPALDRISIVVFAADHGVAEEGVSAFPQAVTAEMVRNFARGGAAISVLARELGATLAVVNAGTVSPLEALEGVTDARVAAGTRNFVRYDAMSKDELARALQAGNEAAEKACADQSQLFIAGEMGIANTTSATAVAAALLSMDARELVGPGTGLDAGGMAHKAELINQALAYHGLDPEQPLDILRRIGGFEIAAIVGVYMRCAQLGISILVDGFITSAAAMIACAINPSVRPWMLFSHASAEPGHRLMMRHLDARPLFDLDMRLGEGSGAAVAVPMLRLALALHNGMATFAEAGVSEKGA